MNNIILAILFSGSLYIIFKSYSKFNIDIYQAIVINYFIAFLVGYFLDSNDLELTQITQSSWLPYSIALGILFISVFFVIGKTTQENGLSVASVASKMSMILPILFGIIYLKEKQNIYLYSGIILGLISVYFVSKKDNSKFKIDSIKYPVLLFIGAGTIDTTINFTQHFHLQQKDVSLFSSATFLSAFAIGIISIIFLSLKKKKQTLALKNLIAGIILGIPNFFSMYYLTLALQNKNLESSIIFTILNIGVILLTTLVGILFFNEKLSKHNYIGIALALTALILVTI